MGTEPAKKVVLPATNGDFTGNQVGLTRVGFVQTWGKWWSNMVFCACSVSNIGVEESTLRFAILDVLSLYRFFRFSRNHEDVLRRCCYLNTEYLKDLQGLGWDATYFLLWCFLWKWVCWWAKNQNSGGGEGRKRHRAKARKIRRTEASRGSICSAALSTVTVESVESPAVTQHAVLRKQHPKRMRRARWGPQHFFDSAR